MRIVADTNVLVSGIINPHRAPGLVVEAAARGDVTLVITARLVSELEQALSYTRVRELIARYGGEVSVAMAVARLLTLVELVPTVAPTADWLPQDPADSWVIQCAITGRADYLVTGDQALLSLGNIQGIRMVSPRDFVDGILERTQ